MGRGWMHCICTGGVIGLLILGLSMVWSELDIETGITVAVALPVRGAFGLLRHMTHGTRLHASMLNRRLARQEASALAPKLLTTIVYPISTVCVCVCVTVSLCAFAVGVSLGERVGVFHHPCLKQTQVSHHCFARDLPHTHTRARETSGCCCAC